MQAIRFMVYPEAHWKSSPWHLSQSLRRTGIIDDNCRPL